AAILPLGVTLESRDPTPATIGPPEDWLLEPDPAVIRAHLISEVADDIGARQLDPQIAYLTADHLIDSPFVTAYRIVDALPFNLRRIQARVRALDSRVEVV